MSPENWNYKKKKKNLPEKKQDGIRAPKNEITKKKKQKKIYLTKGKRRSSPEQFHSLSGCPLNFDIFLLFWIFPFSRFRKMYFFCFCNCNRLFEFIKIFTHGHIFCVKMDIYIPYIRFTYLSAGFITSFKIFTLTKFAVVKSPINQPDRCDFI